MRSMIRIAAVIPARMGSSRLPGKPLLEILGLPMIEHVRRRTLMCRGFSTVVVATCDRQIAAVVEKNGGQVLMTSPKHPAATDRVAEAAQALDCTHVVNVQGDEILVLPSDLERLVQAIQERPEIPAWNAVARIERGEELADRSIVKCALSVSGRILVCARDFSHLPLPAGEASGPLRRILGILAYRKDFLGRYSALARTPLERAESIDQNRIVEHEVLLMSVSFTRGYSGINEQREIPEVRRCLEADPLQQAVFKDLDKGNPGAYTESVIEGSLLKQPANPSARKTR